MAPLRQSNAELKFRCHKQDTVLKGMKNELSNARMKIAALVADRMEYTNKLHQMREERLSMTTGTSGAAPASSLGSGRSFYYYEGAAGGSSFLEPQNIVGRDDHVGGAGVDFGGRGSSSGTRTEEEALLHDRRTFQNLADHSEMISPSKEAIFHQPRAWGGGPGKRNGASSWGRSAGRGRGPSAAALERNTTQTGMVTEDINEDLLVEDLSERSARSSGERRGPPALSSGDNELLRWPAPEQSSKTAESEVQLTTEVSFSDNLPEAAEPVKQPAPSKQSSSSSTFLDERAAARPGGLHKNGAGAAPRPPVLGAIGAAVGAKFEKAAQKHQLRKEIVDPRSFGEWSEDEEVLGRKDHDSRWCWCHQW